MFMIQRVPERGLMKKWIPLLLGTLLLTTGCHRYWPAPAVAIVYPPIPYRSHYYDYGYGYGHGYRGGYGYRGRHGYGYGAAWWH